MTDWGISKSVVDSVSDQLTKTKTDFIFWPRLEATQNKDCFSDYMSEWPSVINFRCTRYITIVVHDASIRVSKCVSSGFTYHFRMRRHIFQ